MEAYIDDIADNVQIDQYIVNDIVSLNELKNVSSSIEKCIVFMSEMFACGVDIKFA